MLSVGLPDCIWRLKRAAVGLLLAVGVRPSSGAARLDMVSTPEPVKTLLL